MSIFTKSLLAVGVLAFFAACSSTPDSRTPAYREPESDSAPADASSPAQPVKPDGLLNEYRARLSRNDHVDSEGGLLQTPAQILRRDRIHFHTLHDPDDEDDDDHYFDTEDHRARFERLVQSSDLSPEVLDKIVHGTPLVLIQVSRQAGVVRLNIKLLKD